MNSTLRTALFEIAREAHSACISANGATAGNCKEAAIALALALEPLKIPVAICQGQVESNRGIEDHYWCRAEGFIVDPTGDQFNSIEGPVVELEEALRHYIEKSFIVFTPSIVSKLLLIITKERGLGSSPHVSQHQTPV
ncbi:MAG: hypothetical protein JNN20_11635 [Betaproteobacteria bacterium]|nr:hypothetical protein [Betaproteobacteria bacterium]